MGAVCGTFQLIIGRNNHTWCGLSPPATTQRTDYFSSCSLCQPQSNSLFLPIFFPWNFFHLFFVDQQRLGQGSRTKTSVREPRRLKFATSGLGLLSLLSLLSQSESPRLIETHSLESYEYYRLPITLDYTWTTLVWLPACLLCLLLICKVKKQRRCRSEIVASMGLTKEAVGVYLMAASRNEWLLESVTLKNSFLPLLFQSTSRKCQPHMTQRHDSTEG